MSHQMTGYMIGGLIPAILFGIYGVLQKATMQRGISPGMFLVVAGMMIMMFGIGYCLFTDDYALSVSSGGVAAITGLVWAMATFLVAVGLSHFGIPVSKLVPLYNMNTLVAVLLGLTIFREWQTVNPGQLLAASVLITLGGILATRA